MDGGDRQLEPVQVGSSPVIKGPYWINLAFAASMKIIEQSKRVAMMVTNALGMAKSLKQIGLGPHC